MQKGHPQPETAADGTVRLFPYVGMIQIRFWVCSQPAEADTPFVLPSVYLPKRKVKENALANPAVLCYTQLGLRKPREGERPDAALEEQNPMTKPDCEGARVPG